MLGEEHVDRLPLLPGPGKISLDLGSFLPARPLLGEVHPATGQAKRRRPGPHSHQELPAVDPAPTYSSVRHFRSLPAFTGLYHSPPLLPEHPKKLALAKHRS